jgi:hypothetical protein
MANTLIPIEERSLTPAEVSALDARRRQGHLLLIIGLQFTVVTVFLTLWSGQDLTYSPGWIHPVFYWNCFTAIVAATCFVRGLALRRGLNEFFSY